MPFAWFRVLLLSPILICTFGSNVPVGHLKVLGSHRPPSVIIDEFTVETAPKPEEFYRDYVRHCKAAVFRGAVLESKAYKTWSDAYIREHYGDLEARIEGKKEKWDTIPAGETYLGRDTFRHFVDTYHNSSSYMVSELPEKMYGDVGVIPSVGACGLIGKRFVEIDIWWNGGGGKSVIHKDAYNQINCLYRGTKHWKLFEYKYEKWIYKHKELEDALGGFSEVNVDRVDLIKHRNFAKIPWANLTIHEGDCLYLPKSYYHQVYSEGQNILAVSLLFSRFDDVNEIDMSDCNEETDYKALRPLSDFDVMWKWPGTGYMTMGWGDIEENYRKELRSYVKSFDKFTVEHWNQHHETFEGFDFSKEKFPDLESRNFTKAFEAFDKNKDGILSVNEIDQSTWDEFRYYALQFEDYEPSNSYMFEYSLIPYERVLKLIKMVLKSQEKLTRQNWIKLYTKETKGTPHYANIVFDGLVGEDDVVICKKITDHNIRRALHGWIKYWAPQYSTLLEHPGRKENKRHREIKKWEEKETKSHKNTNKCDDEENERENVARFIEKEDIKINKQTENRNEKEL